MTQEEEMQKCRDDPAYFYNTYTTYGQKNPLTDQQSEWYNKLANMEGRFVFIRGRQQNYIGQLLKAFEDYDKSEA